MHRKHIEETIANGNGCSCACSRVPKGCIAQKPLQVALVVLLAFALSFMLMGCRDTDVLTQKIIDAPGVSEIDYTLTPVTLDRPDASDEPKDLYEGETDDQNREDAENTPDYREENPDTPQEQTSQQSYDNSANRSSGEASNGGEADGKEGDAAQLSANSAEKGIADKEGDDGREGAGDDKDQQEQSPRGRTIEFSIPETSDDTQQEDNSPQPEQGTNSGQDNDNTWNNNPSGNGGGTSDDNKSGSTYADGTYVTLPSGKIAAAGPYATIVQSLGGRGALAAAPQQWIDSLPAGAYDNKQELDRVKGISSWGDGTVMTDAALQEIIDSDAEVVLTSNTYNVMNQAQADALNDAHIDVVLMPDIGVHNAMDEDIALCVDVIGEMLKDEGESIQFDAKDAAVRWNRQHTKALEECYAANGGYSFAIWGNYYLENYVYQGSSGAAQNDRKPGSSNRILCEYIDSWDGSTGWANPVNPTGSPTDRVSSFDLIDYYFQHSGLTRNTIVISWRNASLAEVDSSGRLRAHCYVDEVGGSRLENPVGLSTPVVIARSEDIARAVSQQAQNDTGSAYNLGSDYSIWVMPAGPDGLSWNDGTFESFLVAPWTYSMARLHRTDDSDGFVKEFYTTFYRPGDGGVAALIEGYGTVVNVACAK